MLDERLDLRGKRGVESRGTLELYNRVCFVASGKVRGGEPNVGLCILRCDLYTIFPNGDNTTKLLGVDIHLQESLVVDQERPKPFHQQGIGGLVISGIVETRRVEYTCIFVRRLLGKRFLQYRKSAFNVSSVKIHDAYFEHNLLLQGRVCECGVEYFERLWTLSVRIEKRAVEELDARVMWARLEQCLCRTLCLVECVLFDRWVDRLCCCEV